VRRKRKLVLDVWPAVWLIVIGVAVYANGLSGPFIFDDHESIVGNPNILHLQPLSSAFSAPVDTPGAGRPLVSVSFALNYAIGGLSPRGYHMWNLAVHLLNGLLLFGVVRRTLERNAPSDRSEHATMVAFASALIWLVHPLQTEVVDYVTQRTESMMAFFYLLTIYGAARAMEDGPGSRRWSLLAIVACACGMACKESMVTAPLMVLLYDWVFGAGTLVLALRMRRFLYAGLATTWAVLIALNASNPRGHSAGLLSEIAPWTYLMNQPPVIVRYLELSLWPNSLVLDYGQPGAVSLGAVIPSAALILALVLATGVLWRRSRAVAFLGVWFFLTLAPTSSLIPIATEVGAERRMYLPLAAVVVLLVTAAVSGMRRLTQTSDAQWPRPLFAAALLIACVVLGALTIRRNAEYHNPVTLWQTVVDRRPQARARYSLAIELGRVGRRLEAANQLELAAIGYPKAHYALGVLEEEDGRHAEAVDDLREYVRLKPLDADVIAAFDLIGQALSKEEKFDEAIAAFQRALSMQPRNAAARTGMADTFMRAGLASVAADRMPDAVHAFAKAVAIDPGDPAKQENLGHALAALGRLDEAVTHYREALARAPAKATLHSALGAVLLAQGKSGEAMTCFQRALEIAPTDDRVRMDVAIALRRFGFSRS